MVFSYFSPGSLQFSLNPDFNESEFSFSPNSKILLSIILLPCLKFRILSKSSKIGNFSFEKFGDKEISCLSLARLVLLFDLIYKSCCFVSGMNILTRKRDELGLKRWNIFYSRLFRQMLIESDAVLIHRLLSLRSPKIRKKVAIWRCWLTLNSSLSYFHPDLAFYPWD